MERTHLVRQRLELTDGKARVMACGDWHLGAKTCDIDAIRHHINLCLEKNSYFLGMGDMLEMATKDSPGSGVFEQDAPDGQVEMVVNLLRPLAERGLIVGIHDGNHERRMTKLTGVNIMKLVCQILGVRYLNHVAYHIWYVGQESYTVYSTHGSSGARLPYTKIKSALDVFRFADTELVLYAHTHGLDHMTQQYKRLNKKTKAVETAIRHAVLTGSFLAYDGSYAEQANLPPCSIGSPVVHMYPDHHEIRVMM